MAIIEVIKKTTYRTLASIDSLGNKTWNKQAFWTLASQVDTASMGTVEVALVSLLNSVNAAKNSILSIQKQTKVTLTVQGWSAMAGGYYQKVAAPGYLINEEPVVALVPATFPFPTAAELTSISAVVNRKCTENGFVTFYASSVPTANLTYHLKGV